MSAQGFVRSFARRSFAAFALATVLAGCGEDDHPLPPDAGDGGVDAGEDASVSCTVETADPPIEGANHVAFCTPVQYGSNPPSSGTHYGSWPVFRAYDKPVPWGFLVHGLEHGAVVISYNCPDGCAADVAVAKQLMQATPARSCGKPPVILVPDPTLTVRFAASSWGHTLRAPCLDKDAFAAFIAAHINHGPELFATDCGVLDQEATGWCP
jgi:hypothetical protein